MWVCLRTLKYQCPQKEDNGASTFSVLELMMIKLPANWRFRVMGELAGLSAQRVLTMTDFCALVDQVRPGTSRSATSALATALVQSKLLFRVSSGLFLNARAIPFVSLNEAASYIRSGAAISLHSVLGECGFLNNPSRIVMAVLPTSTSKRPNLGEVHTSGGAVFRFYGLAERFFPQNDQERWELYQPGRYCDVFRPEAAVLQWFYLANMKRSTLTALPTNVDMTALDEEHLHRLAKKWHLQDELQDWYEVAKALGFDEGKHRSYTKDEVSRSDSELQLASASSAAAKTRVLSRRSK
jgi:hypothetical protein